MVHGWKGDASLLRVRTETGTRDLDGAGGQGRSERGSVSGSTRDVAPET